MKETLIILLITAVLLAAVVYMTWRCYLYGYALGYKRACEDPLEAQQETYRRLYGSRDD